MRASNGRLGRGTVFFLMVQLLCGITQASAAQAAATPKPAAAVDLSGVRLFLDLTAQLEQDKEPTPGQWEALFATPGYAALTKSEFTKEFFVERFKMAFMPSRKADLEAQMKKDTGFWAQFLPHYVKARQMRKEIERRVAEMATAEFTDEAIRRASAFLPSPMPSGPPAVAFVVFGPDARGYDPVVIDILFLNDREEFLNMVAHEFHHWYRNRIATDLTRDEAILWVIQQVALEGTADLINVPAWIDKPVETLDPSDRLFVEWYQKSGEVIGTMDRLFAQMQDGAANRQDLGTQLRKAVPRSGHPTGYFMARTIVDTLGKDAVIRTVSNPFAFFRTYNDAAKRKGHGMPVFSEKAMQFLRSLEKRYQVESETSVRRPTVRRGTSGRSGRRHMPGGSTRTTLVALTSRTVTDDVNGVVTGSGHVRGVRQGSVSMNITPSNRF